MLADVCVRLLTQMKARAQAAAGTDLHKVKAGQQADAVFALLPGRHDRASGFLSRPAGVDEEESRRRGQIRSDP